MADGNPISSRIVLHPLDGVITIELAETPSTGYRWSMIDTASAEVADTSYRDAPGRPPWPGDAGVRTITVRLHDEEPFELVFELRAPWEEHALRRVTAEVVEADTPESQHGGQ